MPDLPARVTCCIAGGGPAGIMLGFLLARAGVEVLWRVYPQTHNWPINQPSGADADDLHNRVWDLFTRNPLP